MDDLTPEPPRRCRFFHRWEDIGLVSLASILSECRKCGRQKTWNGFTDTTTYYLPGSWQLTEGDRHADPRRADRAAATNRLPQTDGQRGGVRDAPRAQTRVPEPLPVVAHKADGETDADRFAVMAHRLDQGYSIDGQHSRFALARLIRREIARAEGATT